MGSLVGAAVLSGCSNKKTSPPVAKEAEQEAAPKPPEAPKPPKAPKPPEAPKPPAMGPGHDHEMASPTLREEVRPSRVVSSKDALGGIRSLKRKTPDLVEVAGKYSPDMLAAGLIAFAGDKPLVRRGDRVVLSPNYALARPQGTGVASDPDLVKAVIQYCFKAGAQDVTCLDHSYSAVPRAFRVNGAFEAVKDTGARLISPWSPDQYVVINDFARGKLHREKLEWQAVPELLLRADVLINLPIFKHHRDAMMSGAVKKLMGLIWRRGVYHETDLHGCIAELASVIRPTVNIMEAQAILSTNGPDGPGKLKPVHKLLISTDPVLADAHACRWLDLDPDKVGYLSQAARLKAGSMDVDKANIVRVKS